MSGAQQAAAHLVSNPAYSLFSEDEAAEFLQGGRVRSFRVGEELLREGALGESLIVITAGQVEVRRGDIRLATLGVGDTLGEMALVDPAPRSATVVGARAGTLIEIDREAFQDRLTSGDPISIKALQAMTSTVFARLVAVNNQVRDEVSRPRGNVFSRLWGGLAGRGKKGRK